MEKIFFIGAAGFVFLSVYSYRIKKFDFDPNSNRFLIKAFVWGMLPFVLSLLLREELKELTKGPTCWVIKFFLTDEHSANTNIPLLMLLSLLFGIFLSCHWIQELLTPIKDWLIDTGNQPKAEGAVGEDWIQFVKEHEVLIFTLRSGKVYVGVLIFADYRDDIVQEQKAVKILPWKSGFRTVMGDVEYTTFYLDDEKLSHSEDASSESEDWPKLVIFQREIVSYTVYDSNLNCFFGHPEDPTS